MAVQGGGTPAIGFPLWFIAALPVLWPLAKGRDWWVLHGEDVRRQLHARVDRLCDRLYDSPSKE